VRKDLIRYVITLAYHQTALLAPLNSLFEAVGRDEVASYEQELHALLRLNAEWRRSDGMAWILYYLHRFSLELPDDLADLVIASGCSLSIAILTLGASPPHLAKAAVFARSLSKSDLHELDSHWLLLYQLFRRNTIRNWYGAEDCFRILKSSGVQFLKEDPAP
jgi:hypothetical protein